MTTYPSEKSGIDKNIPNQELEAGSTSETQICGADRNPVTVQSEGRVALKEVIDACSELSPVTLPPAEVL